MIIWLVGMAGSGKTTIGKALYKVRKRLNPATVFLDGDMVREVLGNDLGHDIESRKTNGQRIMRLCKHLDQQGIDVIACVLSIFPEHLEWNRENYSAYFEIFVDVDMDDLVKRDQKGLYSGAAAGKIPNVVGFDIPFPRPNNPDLKIDNSKPVVDWNSFANEVNKLILGTRNAI